VSKLLVNLGDVVMSPDATFNIVPDERNFHPRLYYSVYVSNTTTTARVYNAQFTRAGTLKGVAFGLYLNWGHFEHPDDLARLVIKLQEFDGTDWVDRATASVTNDQFVPPGVQQHFRDIVKAEFDTPYEIDTEPDKWRFWFGREAISGTDSRYFYLMKTGSGDFEDEGLVIPYLEETDTFDYDGDAIVNFGRIIIDSPADFVGYDISDKGWPYIDPTNSRVLFMNATTYIGEEHPKVIVTENAGQVRVGGIIGISASIFKNEASFYAVKSPDDLDQEMTKKVEIIGWQHSADWRGMFYSYITGRGYGTNRGIKILAEVSDTWRAEMAGTAYAGDTQIRVKGDYTQVWQVGDRIYITTPIRGSNYSYVDYASHEELAIAALEYDADVDETIITLDSELIRYYDFDIYNNLSNARSNCNINPDEWIRYVINPVRDGARAVIRADDDDYCHVTSSRMYTVINNGVPIFHGVRIEDWYYLRFDVDYEKYWTEMVREDLGFSDIAVRFSGYGIYVRYMKDIDISHVQAFLGWYDGTRIAVSRVAMLEYSSRITIDDVFLGGCGFFDIPYGQQVAITNVWFEGDYFLYHRPGTRNFSVRGVTAPTFRRLIYYSNGFGDLDVYDVRGIIAMYHSNYTETSSSYSGLGYVTANYTSAGVVNYYNVTMGTMLDAVYEGFGAQANVFFKDMVVTGTLYRMVTTYNNYYQNFGPGNFVGYENFNGSGIFQVWTSEGYIEGIPNQDGWIDWTIKPLSPEFTVFVEQNTPVTNPGEPVAVVVEVQIEDEAFFAGSHQLPTLKIYGLGVEDSIGSVAVAKPTTEPQQLVAVGTPNATGFFNVRLEFQTDAPDGQNVVRWKYDRVYTSTPRDTSKLDVTYRALPTPTIITELATPYEIWASPKSVDYGSDSIGNAITGGMAALSNPDDFKADVSNLATKDDVNAISSVLSALGDDVKLVLDVELGRQRLADDGNGGTVLIIYAPDNVTEIARFRVLGPDGSQLRFDDLPPTAAADRERI